MSVSSILVQLDEQPASAHRAAVAARLAQRLGAALNGVFVKGPFPFQYFTVENGALRGVDLTAMAAEHDEKAQKAEARARSLFEAAVEAHPPASWSWRELAGDNARPMLEEMRLADLSILPRDHRLNGGDYDLSPTTLTLASGGPVLILPDAAEALHPGRRVMVAWDGSREASRALRSAWPLMQEAQEVFVVTVGAPRDRTPTALLSRCFREHGHQPKIIADPRDDDEAARVIPQQARELGVDLIVMGLYGHMRLTELLMGGVSREVMAHTTVPVLVAH